MITFEKATAADARALTDVQIRTFDDDSRRFAGQESGGPPGYDSVAWQLKIMKIGMYYKIVADGQIIGGLIVFDQGHRHYELGRIYIDPGFQNRGIGMHAMRFIEEAFPTANRWTLDTPCWATRNHHFYERLGYVKVGEMGQGQHVGFLYEKVIPT